MKIEGLNSQFSTANIVNGSIDKKKDDKAPPGLLESAMEAAEKILVDSGPEDKKNLVNIKV